MKVLGIWTKKLQGHILSAEDGQSDQDGHIRPNLKIKASEKRPSARVTSPLNTLISGKFLTTAMSLGKGTGLYQLSVLEENSGVNVVHDETISLLVSNQIPELTNARDTVHACNPLNGHEAKLDFNRHAEVAGGSTRWVDPLRPKHVLTLYDYLIVLRMTLSKCFL